MALDVAGSSPVTHPANEQSLPDGEALFVRLSAVWSSACDSGGSLGRKEKPGADRAGKETQSVQGLGLIEKTGGESRKPWPVNRRSRDSGWAFRWEENFGCRSSRSSSVWTSNAAFGRYSVQAPPAQPQRSYRTPHRFIEGSIAACSLPRSALAKATVRVGVDRRSGKRGTRTRHLS